MSRRRRLALRQIEEPPIAAAALSDVEDEHKRDEAAVEEPNFDLLAMMAAEEAPRVETPVILIDDDEPMGETQILNTADGFRTPPRKRRLKGGEAPAASSEREEMVPTLPLTESASDVFQLYQSGLCADHTLRLHYIRRRPPPPKPRPVEERFLLPRPRLCLLDVLPPHPASIQDILDSIDPAADSNAVDDGKRSLQEVHEAVKSASSHWRQLAIAPEDAVISWRGLQECDWQEVYSQNNRFVPDLDVIVRLLDTLGADGFAAFTWRELLVPAVRALVADAAASAKLARLATALLRHAHFQRLPAKDFRAQLRGKNLRVEAPRLGAEAELVLATHFHKYRN